MVDHAASMMPAQTEQLQEALKHLSQRVAVPGAGAAAELQPQQAARLRQSCQDFEALFLSQMFKAMRQTVVKSGLSGGGAGEELFQQLHDEAVAEQTCRNRSLGLSEIMYRQLVRDIQAGAR
ncbi:MAG: rod-binding protein [Candidatus Omnitrophica bacterium]|nr:rod-binding protein [Candidatus Omnitrophota bacterium]